MLLAMFFTFHIALHQLFVPLFIFSIFHTQWYKPNSLWYIPANKFGLSQLMYILHNPKSNYSLLSTWCWPILKLKLFAVPRLMMILPWATLLLWFLMFSFLSIDILLSNNRTAKSHLCFLGNGNTMLLRDACAWLYNNCVTIRNGSHACRTTATKSIGSVDTTYYITSPSYTYRFLQKHR